MNAPPGARILVVCTGNVCRSPLVERLLRPALDQAFGPGGVAVDSAGTGALVDAPMDERAAGVLRDLGGDPTGFVARQVSEPMVAGASLVLTATRAHRAAVVRLHPRALRYAFTVRELAVLVGQVDPLLLPGDPAERVTAVAELARGQRGTLARYDPEELDVVDPFRQADQVYARMREQVAPAVDALRRVLAPR